MADDQELCLRWNRFSDHIAGAFEGLFVQQRLLDVTLCCEGRNLHAHRVVLSACSPVFDSLLTAPQSAGHPNPFLIFTDILYDDLSLLIEFMYRGHITVKQSLLPRVLRAAENLRIHGLCQNTARFVHGERTDLEEKVSSSPESSSSAVTTKYLDVGNLNSAAAHEEAASSQNPTAFLSQSLASGTFATPTTEQSRPSTSKKVMATISEPGPFLTSMEEERSLRHRSKIGQHVPRLRVFWRRGQVAQLESWYKKNRYPNVQQAQEYASSLARLFPDGPIPTTQNVANWFQNRRRRDNHPDVQEKRDKKRNSKQRKELPESEVEERPVPSGTRSVLGRMLEALDKDASDSEQNMEEGTAQEEEEQANEDSKLSMSGDHSDEETYGELQDLSLKGERHHRD